MLKEKVTANQFFLLLYLSLLSTVFMYLSSTDIKIAQTDALLRPLVFIGIGFLVFIPICLITKKHSELAANGQYIKKTTFLKCVSFIYAIVYFVGILKATARFDLFVSSELFPNSDMTVFLVLIIAVCALLSALGLGALSRAASVFAFLVCVSTAVVMFSLSDEVDFLNFTPLFQKGIGEFIKEGTLFAIQATEIGTIIMFIPDIKGNVKRSFVRWTLLSAISFSLIFFFVIGSLGSFADTQLFPTYTSVTLASLGLLERIDALETAIWILCVVERLSFYFFVCIKALRYTFSDIPKKYLTAGTVVLVGAVIAFVSYDINNFAFLSANTLTVALFLSTAVVLPTAVYIYIRKVKPCDKVQENI